MRELTIPWLGRVPTSIVQPGTESLAGRAPRSLVEAAKQYRIYFADVPGISSYVRHVVAQERSTPALIFHLQAWHFIPILLSFWRPVYWYYQNRIPAHLPFHKAFVFRLLLRLVSGIIVQDQCCFAYFSRLFPRKTYGPLPWFVDSEFYALPPRKVSTGIIDLVGNQPFVLIPGDRGRDHAILSHLARNLPFTYIRVSRSISSRETDRLSSLPGVHVLRFIPYDDLLWLYRNATVVLNLVDDSSDSAGMTVLFEAMSCGASIITPSGHSSAGYVESSRNSSVLLVPPSSSPSVWVDAFKSFLARSVLIDSEDPSSLLASVPFLNPPTYFRNLASIFYRPATG